MARDFKMAYGRRVMRKTYRRKRKSRTIRKRKPTRRARKAIRRTAKKPSLPSCTKLYAKALLDPSDPSVVGVCYPSGMTLPSQKFHEKIKGSFVVPEAGKALILIQDTLCNDQAAILTTTSATVYASDDNTGINTAIVTGSTEYLLTKCPYSQADFTEGRIDGRMVVCGFKYRYAGRQDALSGVCYDLEDPDHSDQINEVINAVKSHRNADQHPVDNEWHYVKWSGPVRIQEENYYATGFAGESGQFFGVALIYAPPQSIFVFEADYHIEYHGNAANGATFNDIDTTGTAKVINAAKKDAQTHSTGYLASMIGYVSDAVTKRELHDWALKETLRGIEWKKYSWMAAKAAAAMIF